MVAERGFHMNIATLKNFCYQHSFEQKRRIMHLSVSTGTAPSSSVTCDTCGTQFPTQQHARDSAPAHCLNFLFSRNSEEADQRSSASRRESGRRRDCNAVQTSEPLYQRRACLSHLVSLHQDNEYEYEC